MKISRLYNIQLFSAAGMGAIANYFSIFAKDIGLTDAQIGLTSAMYALTTLISIYVFGHLSDRFNKKLIIMAGLFLSSMVQLFYLVAWDFSSLLVVRIIGGMFAGMFPSALVVYYYQREKALDKFTSFNSLGYGVGNVLSAIATVFARIGGIFAASFVTFIISGFSSMGLEKDSHDAGKSNRRIDMFDYRAFRRNLVVYISIVLRHTGAWIAWTFWGLYLVQLGASLFWVGIISLINLLAQFVVMNTLTDRMNKSVSIKMGILLSSVTFLLFGFVKDFWQMLPVQILLGVAWSFTYIGSLRTVVGGAKNKGAASGMLESVLDIPTLIGPIIATIAIHFVDYRGLMFLGSGVAFLGFLTISILGKNQNISRNSL